MNYRTNDFTNESSIGRELHGDSGGKGGGVFRVSFGMRSSGPVGHLQFFENEILQVGISLPSAAPVGLEDYACNAVDDGFGTRPRDLSRQNSEIFASFGAEQGRFTGITVA